MNRSRLNRKPKTYASLKAKTWLSVLLVIITFSIPTTLFWYGGQVDRMINVKPVYAQTPKYEEPIKDPTSQQQQIVNYINEVFGNDADKAFKLLSCENKSLNPNAVNTAGNLPEGSRDTGVFQINEYWQKTQYKFLLNWKINIEIAHQLYTENGNSFERWTCGRKLGV